MEHKNEIVAMTADIVSAFVSANSIEMQEIPGLIEAVHGALQSVAVPVEEKPAMDQVPAVPVKKSVQHDFIICLEDGKSFKSLKRHLRTRYGMTPDEYRMKWGLPADYPMVAPSYAEARSILAIEKGLGRKKSPHGDIDDAARNPGDWQGRGKRPARVDSNPGDSSAG